MYAGPGAADRVLARRRRTAVRVVGAARLGAPLAALLAAAGVGQVVVDDPLAVRSADAAPGGVSSADTGVARERATAIAIRRAAPEVRTDVTKGRVVDLTVLTDGMPTAQEQAALLRAQLPHLAVGIRETTGLVGPLVVPGSSACLRCLELARAERDPCWARLAAQLAGRRDRLGDPCDVVLAAVVAAQGAGQALQFIDRAATGAALPPTVNGTLELSWPDYRWRRRTWSAHPACGCCWAQSA
jgi:hypothetical protein